MAQLARRLSSAIPRSVVVSLRSMSTSPGPVEATIRQKLEANFEPKHLQIMNESYMHNVPRGSETHFKVVVVSDRFDSVPLIKRHRLVNECLDEELKAGVHALSIVAKTTEQWEKANQDLKVDASPACRGGFGK